MSQQDDTEHLHLNFVNRVAIISFTTPYLQAEDAIEKVGTELFDLVEKWECSKVLLTFDGVRFVSYGTLDGLPSATINRVLETRRGEYWIATNGGGVARFNPTGMRPTTWRHSRSRRP